MGNFGRYSNAAAQRTVFAELLNHLRADPNVVLLEVDEELFNRGVDLYGKRPDKDWSLTDCISFIVMEDFEMTDALTADHHFEQAGFTILLK